jgi:hypothetical protein
MIEVNTGPQGIWHTKIDTLLELVRHALISLMPTFDLAQIGWQSDENYDDFDRIAEALYDSIVRDSVRNAIGLEDCAALPRYGFSSADGASYSRIVVLPDRTFISFVSRIGPFDHILTEERGARPGDTARTAIPYSPGIFELEAVEPSGRRRASLKELEVRL